jgi:hypothetical protein
MDRPVQAGLLARSDSYAEVSQGFFVLFVVQASLALQRQALW